MPPPCPATSPTARNWSRSSVSILTSRSFPSGAEGGDHPVRMRRVMRGVSWTQQGHSDVAKIALFNAVFFATYLTLACCSGPRRHFPWNLILLTIFTLSMAYLTGMLSSYYNTTSVLLCLSITALVCLSVTVFSFQTKFDFTSCQGVLFVLLMTLFFSGLILAILLPFQYVPWLHAVYAVLGAGVFTLFLAFDTQLLMGSRRHSLSPEEYIFGALNIYLDIIYIFTFFLQLFGTNRE
ncbi:hypothetical protein FD754_009377 [Muntiacus muntjak]|uniref:Protein lifeguard 2 n=1 Tax=Muntiacus muntjak TaxID=9888 RepID=A0A5N3WUB7_MUNMU|nr:hypothetical protein FD754_009377 [Muntiacus muntjak]